ncbi:MAG: MFS transporter [Candidatus Muproteobacteria bacterium RIFCSPHIGHO2_02_FULL_65_16]|uniref:MFS transporter n=1 Tax=Candidatus Muproteobacteria bacterium RIFCSPHIGHO2_02_FULL_65_16 TaxID=1817766 RepID=A0A1F6TZH5_9PROT|nr:MAG: MFS transporter [Candidatus Muproteobacteria bacterium RIFCSPHIGHO2_02_FULL_65_16]
MPPKPRTAPLPRAVVVVGFVSLLNDFAGEMVVPLIPLLLATVLAAGPAALGLIEGVAEMVSNLLKLWSGRHSDLYNRRRKPYVLLGYTLSNIVRPLIGISGSWLTVLAIRVTDRVGKGVRTAPRDALVADAIADGTAGHAFGLIRALDHVGAVLGSLAAAAVVYWGTQRLDIVIAISAIPGLLAVLLIAFGVKEPARVRHPLESLPPLKWSLLDRPARRYLLTIGFFTLGKIPETFLLLRGHQLGMPVVELLLLWAAMHVVKAAISEQAGRHTDRVGRRPLILAGWMVYAVTLFALAFVTTGPMLWAWSMALGFYFGLTEGAERALVRDLAAPAGRGTAFGWFHMIVGLAAIPAGLLLGGLWALVGVKAAFLTSAALAALAAAGFWRWGRT